MTPWLSILIPVFNVEKYLGECLASVLEQCDAGVEIIVLDDQSTDGSFQLAQKIAASTSHNLRVLQQEKNGGISIVRNQLLAAAGGSYIWFVDSDDVIAGDAIAELREIIAAHSPDLIMCDYCLWRTELTISTKFFAGTRQAQRHVSSFAGKSNSLQIDQLHLFAGLYKKGKLHIWSKIFKREAWCSELAFPEGRYFEDMAVSPLLALKVNTYYYVPKIWVYYRQRAGSILAVPSLKKIEDMNAGVNGVLSIWLQKYPEMSISARFIFVNYCVKIFYFSLKELKKLGAYNATNVAHFRLQLLHNAQCNKWQLIGLYVRSGELFRLLKLLPYL